MLKSFALTFGTLSLGLIISSPAAHATLTVSSAVGGAPTGVSYATFNSIPLGTAGGVDGAITVSFQPPSSGAVTGATAGVNAAPVLSGGNGANFGNQPNGVDTTTYLTTGTGSVTLTFSSPQMYFGLLWGSVDTYNSLTFYDSSNNIIDGGAGVVTGSQVFVNANGNQGASGTFYVNINSTVAFSKVIARSTSNAFEFDNVAYNATPVPEPSTVAVAISALPIGLVMWRKRRKRTQLAAV